MQSMLMPARGMDRRLGPPPRMGQWEKSISQRRQGGLPRVGGISAEAQTVVRPSTLLVQSRGARG